MSFCKTHCNSTFFSLLYHRGYTVVCLSPVIEAVRVTSIPPTHKGRKLWKISNFHLLITSFSRPLASQITIIIWDWHVLIDIFKYSCGYLPVNSLQSPSTFPHPLCHHELDVFLSKIQLRNGRISHYTYNCGPWCYSPNFILRSKAPDIKLYHSPYPYFEFTSILLYMNKGNGRVWYPVL